MKFFISAIILLSIFRHFMEGAEKDKNITSKIATTIVILFEFLGFVFVWLI